MAETVVLIGPPAAGKSTAGPLLAARLAVDFVDVDEVGDLYYGEVGQPLSSFVERIAECGFEEAHRWWQPARLRAARRVVGLHMGSVVAFGAGHSHFEDPTFFEEVSELLADCRVVLLLPDADLAFSTQVLRERCISAKGDGWVRDGHDFLLEWVTSGQNQLLADVVVYSDGSTPAEFADSIEAALGTHLG